MDRSRDIARLLEIMARLRHPTTGCSWDIRQTFESIIPYTLEEAYEVADAVQRHDMADLRDELGDLLLQVVFHARMAEETGAFDFGDVVDAITGKLIRRHPHIFGEARDLSPEQVKALWAEIKASEKRDRAKQRGVAPSRLLGDVAPSLPALTRALKLQNQAATVGFDWDDVRLVLDKIREETDEVAEALDGAQVTEIEDEIGDLLFAVVNLARHAGVDPESALRKGNAKFERRFAHIEDCVAARSERLADTPLAEMERLWAEAKRHE